MIKFTDEQLERVLANSYQDFHAKGVDYLCLERGENMTHKVYFFDNAAEGNPEVVAPHDHRYEFVTTCLAGGVMNHLFGETDNRNEPLYTCYSWYTPLNDGKGFSQYGFESRLRHLRSETYAPGQAHVSRHTDIHTISVQPGTILSLMQLHDIRPIGLPTYTWVPGQRSPAPSLDGLYTPMTADRALLRLAQLETTCG